MQELIRYYEKIKGVDMFSSSNRNGGGIISTLFGASPQPTPDFTTAELNDLLAQRRAEAEAAAGQPDSSEPTTP